MLRQPTVIPFEPRTFDHLPIFVLKCRDLVMLSLVDNIVDDSVLITNAAGKSAIFLSPSLELAKARLKFCPLAAALLDISHQVTQTHRR